MSIPQKVHDALDEIELHSLIEACANCRCGPDFPCYCDRNLEWAERKLEELRARRSASNGAD